MTHWIQRLTNRESNFGEMAYEIGQFTAEPIDLDSFCESFLKQINETLRPHSSGLFLKQKAAGRFHLYARAGLAVKDIALDLNHPLPTYFCNNHTPLSATDLDVLPQFRALWDEERVLLQQLDAQLFLPLKASGDLVGILMMGHKRSGGAYTPNEVQKLSILANQAAMIIRLKYLSTAESRYQQEAEAMQEALSEITAPNGLQESLQRTLQHIHEAFAYDTAYIALLQGDRLVINAVQGFTPAEDFLDFSYPVDSYLPFQSILETRESLLVEDTSQDERFNPIGGPPVLRAWLGVPLIYQGEVSGLLAMSSQKMEGFQVNPARMGLVQALVNQAAVIVKISHLIQVERQQRQLADILKNIAGEVISIRDYDQMLDFFIERISKVMPADITLLFLKKGGQMDLARSSLGADFDPSLAKIVSEPAFEASAFSNLHYLVNSNQPVVIADTEKDLDWILGPISIRSWAGVPVISEGEVEGCFTFSSLQPGVYHEEMSELLSIFSEQTALALRNFRLNNEVHQLTIEDELTGLFNRRHFMDLGEREFRRARRFQHQLSVMIVDIDQFKKVNEKYGENASNQVLLNIANVIQTNVRNVDIPTRYQQEKFAVLLTETDRAGARIISDRLRELIAEIPNITTAGLVKITVSIGVAIMEQDTPNLAELMNTAILAMNEAKRTGRNRIVLYPKEESN
jgi:diguanylate cyclase (GGDEF)-like protein